MTAEKLQITLENQNVYVTSEMLIAIIEEGIEHTFTESQLSDYNFKKAWVRKVLKAQYGKTLEGRLVLAMEVYPELDEYVEMIFGE